MIAIRNSKFYVLIALLLSITTFVYAGYLIVLWGVIKAIATVAALIAATITLIKALNELIKSEEQKLQDMEDDLADAEEEQKANRARYKELKNLIEEEDAAAQQAQSELYTADLEYEAAETAYEAAKKDVKEKSEASRKAKTAYDDHIYDCLYCEGSVLCPIGTRLSNQMSAAQTALQQAKVSQSFARSTYKSAEKDKDKWQSELNKHTKKRDDYQEEQNELTESHATLLIKITTLTKVDIPKKVQAIIDAKADLAKKNGNLSKHEKQKKALEDWKSRCMAAYDAGEDMVEWFENNPAPAH